MGQVLTKTFQSGDSEAVHLPKELAFGVGTEVVIETIGDALKIYRAPEVDYLAKNRALARALLEMPGPCSIEVRDTEEIPEREGL
jgi:antitoxin VapB